MASIVITDGVITLNAVNVSPLIRKVTIPVKVEEQDDTAMGDTYHSRIGGGLKDYSFQLELNQDFAASQTDATIWPLLGTVVPIKAKATSAANSATNPEYQGNVLVAEYSPLDASVGDLGKVSVTWPGSGTLTRAVV